MTPRLLGCCVLTLVIPLVAGTQEPDKDKPLGSETPYYPLAAGTQWTYQVGDHRVSVRVARTEVVEIKMLKPDADKKLREENVKVQAYHIESKSDDRVQSETVAVLEDGIYRLAAAGKDIVPPLCFFKLPPKPGESWQVQSMTEGMPLQGTFTTKEEEVEVPAFKGKFKAIKAYSDDFQIGKSQMKLAYWFYPKVGLVQQHLQFGSFEVLMKLERVTTKKP
jgi:hypothetical protein